MKKYDLVVIGGGAAGLVAASGAASLGARTALIDKARLGGDCLWSGCVPTKSLLHTARMVHDARRINQLGLEWAGTPDFTVVKARIQKAIAQIERHDDPQRFRQMGIDVYQGVASFHNANIINVHQQEALYGKRIVIATGSKTFIPPIQGLAQTGFLTNESVLELEELPSSLLIIGGGPIGLEFAQAFSRLGVKVTVVERASEILIKEEDELIPYVKQALANEGIQIITSVKVLEAKVDGQQKSIVLEKDGQQQTITADEIFLASGRKPNIEGLQLEQAGVDIGSQGVPVNAYLQTNVRNIYAAGDVTGVYGFTHAAGYEGKIIVSNAVLGLRRKVNYSHLPWVIYTDPEVFHLGLTEREARARYSRVKVYRTELKEVDRFITDDETDGLIKIITDAKGKILGAHAVASSAGDLLQEVVFAKQFGHNIGSISQVIHPYPGHTGAVQRTADLYWREKLFDSKWSKWVKTYTRWFR